MTDKEKLKKIKELADAMYYAAQYLTTDASRLHKAMDEYHKFIINEYHKEEPINYDKLNTMLDDALAKETKESLNERLGISQEERDAIVDKYLYGKEPELVDVDDLPNEEPVSEDLGDYINELSKQFQEVSFAKLSRIAVRVAKWQKQHLWKPADGDYLPEYDREVIAILDYDFGHYKVVYAHRPNPNGWDGTNIDTGEKEHFEPVIYDKGGWNQPHALYWLDAKLPYE